MHIAPFSPIGNSFSVDATIANARTQVLAAADSPTIPKTLRVVNEGATPVLIAMGDATVDAITDTQVMSVMPGERVFTFKPGATYVAYAMRSGSAKVQFQLGAGV